MYNLKTCTVDIKNIWVFIISNLKKIKQMPNFLIFLRPIKDTYKPKNNESNEMLFFLGVFRKQKNFRYFKKGQYMAIEMYACIIIY